MKNNLNDILSLMRRTDNTFNLNESIINILYESHMDIESIYKKHYSDIKREDFDLIINADPTTKKNMGGVKMGKYCKWLLKLYGSDKLDMDSLDSIKESLEKFNKLKKKKNSDIKSNIEDYHSIDDLDKDINDNKDELEKKSSKEIKKEGSKIIIEDDDIKVIHLKNMEAAMLYSKGTVWCTGGKTNNRFYEYSNKGYLFVIIDKSEKRKIQINLDRDGQVIEARDEENDEFYDLYEYDNEIDKIKEYIENKEKDRNSTSEKANEFASENDMEVKDSMGKYSIVVEKSSGIKHLLDTETNEIVSLCRKKDFKGIGFNWANDLVFVKPYETDYIMIVNINNKEVPISIDSEYKFDRVYCFDEANIDDKNLILYKNLNDNIYNIGKSSGNSITKIDTDNKIYAVLNMFTINGNTVFMILNGNDNTEFLQYNNGKISNLSADNNTDFPGETEFPGELHLISDENYFYSPADDDFYLEISCLK